MAEYIFYIAILTFCTLQHISYQTHLRATKAAIKKVEEGYEIESHSTDVITRYVLLDIIKKSVDKQDYETASEAKKMVDIIEKRIFK